MRVCWDLLSDPDKEADAILIRTTSTRAPTLVCVPLTSPASPGTFPKGEWLHGTHKARKGCNYLNSKPRTRAINSVGLHSLMNTVYIAPFFPSLIFFFSFPFLSAFFLSFPIFSSFLSFPLFIPPFLPFL